MLRSVRILTLGKALTEFIRELIKRNMMGSVQFLGRC